MTATNGGTEGLTFDINVTPMIDVLLVLLVIFMLIVPAVPRGETAIAPHSSLSGSNSSDAVVLQVLKRADSMIEFRVNQQPVAHGDLKARLAAIYSNRADRALFVKGDDQLSFTQIADAIDIGHSAGADRIGIMTPKVLASR